MIALATMAPAHASSLKKRHDISHASSNIWPRTSNEYSTILDQTRIWIVMIDEYCS